MYYQYPILYDSELTHYGIKGMRWGVRKRTDSVVTTSRTVAKNVKDKNLATREKMKKVAANDKAHIQDVQIAEYHSQSYTKKVASTVRKNIAKQVVKDILTGQVAHYKDRSLDDWRKVGMDIAKNSAKDLAVNEALAVSVASKYDSNGKNKSGKENGRQIFTRETAATTAYSIGSKVYPFASAAAGMKYGQMKANRRRNEEKFNAWGGRILESPVYDNIVDLNAHEYRVR